MINRILACACIMIMACVFAGCSKKNGGELVYRVDTGIPSARVTGKVKAVSKLPQKGATPYWDCITAVWLTDVKSDNDEIKNAKDGILVYVVSLDGGEETDNAAITEGDTVTMELVPWKNAENKYGSYQRIEIDDPDSYVLDVWFKNDKVAKKEEKDD
ncbi:MAG: hypothetical protein IJT95_05455 [Abditibacteriota bacterium]|nr:hypothetical protein [Abditibacteriota bacterium]